MKVARNALLALPPLLLGYALCEISEVNTFYVKYSLIFALLFLVYLYALAIFAGRPQNRAAGFVSGGAFFIALILVYLCNYYLIKLPFFSYVITFAKYYSAMFMWPAALINNRWGGNIPAVLRIDSYYLSNLLAFILYCVMFIIHSARRRGRGGRNKSGLYVSHIR